MTDQAINTTGEEDMANMAQRFFSRASDAIVQASKLAKVVEDLQAQLTALSAEVAQVKAQNEQLVAELHNVTVERDDFRQRFWQSEAEHNETKQALAELQARHDALGRDHQAQGELLANTQGSLSDMVARSRQLEDLLAEAQTKLDAIAAIVYKAVAKVEEASPPTDPSPASPEASTGGNGEQLRGEDGTFGPVPMAARDFQY
jgi:chromosome segregation ATPase